MLKTTSADETDLAIIQVDNLKKGGVINIPSTKILCLDSHNNNFVGMGCFPGRMFYSKGKFSPAQIKFILWKICGIPVVEIKRGKRNCFRVGV
jgi:hypothetical protein